MEMVRKLEIYFCKTWQLILIRTRPSCQILWAAMTEGSIGFWLQNALENELTKEGIDKEVTSVVTQVIVDKSEPAFENLTQANRSILH